jgi:hypothetical protein
MRRHYLILLKKRSTKLRARFKYGLKQIGPLRFCFGGMLAHAPRSPANVLIQSASYPRSASNIAPDFRSDSRSASVNHLDRAVMGFREGIHDRVPDTSHPPTNKPVVAGRVSPKVSGRSRHGAPDRNIQKMPLRTRRSSTLGTPRGLFGRNGLMAVHSKSVSSYRMVRCPGSGALNHVYLVGRNTELQVRDGADIGRAANMLKSTRLTQDGPSAHLNLSPNDERRNQLQELACISRVSMIFLSPPIGTSRCSTASHKAVESGQSFRPPCDFQVNSLESVCNWLQS